MEHKFILTRMGQDTVGAGSAIELIEKFPYYKLRDWGLDDNWSLFYKSHDDETHQMILINTDFIKLIDIDVIDLVPEICLILFAFRSIDLKCGNIDLNRMKRYYNAIIDGVHAYSDAAGKNMELVAKYPIHITSEFMKEAKHDLEIAEAYSDTLDYFTDNKYLISKIKYESQDKEEE